MVMCTSYILLAKDPDNDELPLIRKRAKPPSAHQKPKDPDCQLLPNDILEYYDDRPSSFRLPSVAPKWRPMSFAGNPKTDGEVREQVEQDRQSVSFTDNRRITSL